MHKTIQMNHTNGIQNLKGIRIFAYCLIGIVLFSGTALQAEVLVEQSFTGTTATGWTFVTGQGVGPVLTSSSPEDPKARQGMTVTNI